MDTDYQLAYARISKLLKQMFIAEDEYLKNRSDQGKQGRYFALKKEVKNIIEPKQTSQAKIDWLGQ